MIQDLFNEIWHSPAASPVIRHKEAEKEVKLPATPSPAYQAYLGKRRSYEPRSGDKTLRLENLKLEGVESLVISIRAQ